MTDCIVFNHHSLPFDHPDPAEKAVPDFMKTCIEAKNAGLQTILVDQKVDTSWFLLELAPGYFWKNWHDIHQDGKNRDLIRAFRSIVTQSPLFHINDIEDGADLFEVIFDGCKAYSALCAAAWHEAPMVGFETRSPWNDSPLVVKIIRINPVTTDIEQSRAEIHNFYCYSIFRHHLPELLQKRNASLSSGKEIVDRAKALYPGVSLCGKAIQQLNNWSASLTILGQVKQSLSILSAFSVKWQTNEIPAYRTDVLKACGLPFQVSGESQTVRDTPKLRRQREFWLPSGQQKYFEQHVKISFGYRLHFFPDNETRHVYVGYIGPHLKLK